RPAHMICGLARPSPTEAESSCARRLRGADDLDRGERLLEATPPCETPCGEEPLEDPDDFNGEQRRETIAAVAQRRVDLDEPGDPHRITQLGGCVLLEVKSLGSTGRVV